MKVIINADDFGISAGTNKAIIESFKNKWISSTTVLTNMPGFVEACALVRDHSLDGRVGLHFNLTTGKPLSKLITSHARLCSTDGELNFSIHKGMFLSRAEAVAIAEELSAQWNACLKNGISPTHLDSHHHTHLAWGTAKVVIEAARDLDIPAVRVHWNVPRVRTSLRGLYARLINLRYRHAGLMVTPYMAHSLNGRLAIEKGLVPLEIMVHPTLAPDGTIIDYKGGKPLQEVFDKFSYRGPLLSYRDLLEDASD